MSLIDLDLIHTEEVTGSIPVSPTCTYGPDLRAVFHGHESPRTAQTALGAAQNAELKDLITKAAPNLQAHLAKAQDIQGKLNAAPAAGATADTGAAKAGSDTSKKGTKKP